MGIIINKTDGTVQLNFQDEEHMINNGFSTNEWAFIADDSLFKEGHYYKYVDGTIVEDTEKAKAIADNDINIKLAEIDKQYGLRYIRDFVIVNPSMVNATALTKIQEAETQAQELRKQL